MSRHDRGYALRRPAGEHRDSCPARAATSRQQRRGRCGLDHLTTLSAAPERLGYRDADGDGLAVADGGDVAFPDGDGLALAACCAWSSAFFMALMSLA